jgi:hypothetical protein
MYLILVPRGKETDEIHQARENLMATRDISAALEQFPSFLHAECAILYVSTRRVNEGPHPYDIDSHLSVALV